MPDKMLPVAFGGLKTYKQCPHKYYRTKVKKDITEDFSSEAIQWGNRVHKAFEDYFKIRKPLSKEMVQYQKYVDALDRIKGDRYVEHRLGMDVLERPVDFFDAGVMYRGIIDFLVVAPCGTVGYMIDHKTGKVRPDDQMAFLALLTFANFPEMERINAAFYWLPADTSSKYVFLREDTKKLWNKFDEALSSMEASFENDLWPKNKTALCGWCPVTDCENHPEY